MVGILGETQMAALTLANIPVFVVILFLFGVQNGSSVLISQYWGKQDIASIEKVVGIGMWLSMILTGIFSWILFCYPLEFLSLFGNDPEVIALAAGYGKIIGLSYFLNGFTMMYAGAYRCIGQAKLGMYLMGASMVVNLFLNWVLIYGNLGFEAMGVAGAAYATLAARFVEVLMLLYHGCFGKERSLPLGKLFSWDVGMSKRFFKYCAPVILSETSWGLGTSMFPTVMGHMEGSTEILAAYSIATNMEKLVMVVGFGIGASAGILIGNHIGAGCSKEKALSLGKCLSTLGFLCGLLSGLWLLLLTFTLFPSHIAPLFVLSPEATVICQIMLLFLSIIMACRTYNTVAVVGVFRAGGDPKKSMLVDLLPLWAVAIPLTVLVGSVLKLHIFWVMLASKTEDLVKFFAAFHFVQKPTWIHDVTQSLE